MSKARDTISIASYELTQDMLSSSSSSEHVQIESDNDDGSQGTHVQALCNGMAQEVVQSETSLEVTDSRLLNGEALGGDNPIMEGSTTGYVGAMSSKGNSSSC